MVLKIKPGLQSLVQYKKSECVIGTVAMVLNFAVLCLPDKTVGVEHVTHPGKLFLEVALELLLSHGHGGEEVLQGDGGAGAAVVPGHGHQRPVMVVLQQRARVCLLLYGIGSVHK